MFGVLQIHCGKVKCMCRFLYPAQGNYVIDSKDPNSKDSCIPGKFSGIISLSICPTFYSYHTYSYDSPSFPSHIIISFS